MLKIQQLSRGKRNQFIEETEEADADDQSMSRLLEKQGGQKHIL